MSPGLARLWWAGLPDHKRCSMPFGAPGDLFMPREIAPDISAQPLPIGMKQVKQGIKLM